jgi:DNA helicase HerA-like ATPase
MSKERFWNLGSLNEDDMRSVDVLKSWFGKFYLWQSQAYTFFGFVHKGLYYVIFTSKREEYRPRIKLSKPMGLAFYLNRERDIFEEL